MSLSGAAGGGAAEVAHQLYVDLQDNDYLAESGKYSTCMVQFKPLVTTLTVAFAHYYVHVFSHPSIMIEAIIIQIQHKCTSAHDWLGYLHQVMSWIAIVMYVVYAVARLHQEITGGCTAQFCMAPPTALICMAPHTKLLFCMACLQRRFCMQPHSSYLHGTRTTAPFYIAPHSWLFCCYLVWLLFCTAAHSCNFVWPSATTGHGAPQLLFSCIWCLTAASLRGALSHLMVPSLNYVELSCVIT